MRKIQTRNQQKEYRRQLKEEKKKGRKGLHIETSKLFAIYLFVLMNAIIIYSMVAMWKFQDFSYLGVLISDIAAQILIYGIYCMKAFKAKQSEEDLKFKREKYYGTLGNVLHAGADSDHPVPVNGDVETFTEKGDVIDA
jgi:exonuclease III